MNNNKFPLTYPKTDLNIQFYSELNINFDKCISIFKSTKKHKVIGKIINVYENQTIGRHGSGNNVGDGIIVESIEYKSLDGKKRIGESYRDSPADTFGIGKNVEIYYTDDDYNFVFIDELQFVKNDENFLDTKEKQINFIKSAKPYIFVIITSIILGLLSIYTLNSYILLSSQVFTLFSLIFLFTKKSKAESVGQAFLIPYFLNLFITIYYIFNYMIIDINNIQIISYFICILQFSPPIIFYIFIKIKSFSKKIK